jgi:hypothetical protein
MLAPRGFPTSLAQAGAVVVEPPTLRRWLDRWKLMDTRLKTYDCAVRLWESLLAQDPQTSLRTLTLYRLGWAYRSCGVEGFPREIAAVLPGGGLLVRASMAYF